MIIAICTPVWYSIFVQRDRKKVQKHESKRVQGLEGNPFQRAHGAKIGHTLFQLGTDKTTGRIGGAGVVKG